MGAAYVVQKKYGQALSAYEEALKLDPDRIDALGPSLRFWLYKETEKPRSRGSSNSWPKQRTKPKFTSYSAS